MSQCFPFWHDFFRQYEGKRYPVLCSVDVNPESPTFGFVPCSPERLRAHAEAHLHRAGLWSGRLPLRVYALARNAATEQGDGTPEEKMAVVLTTINQAKRRRVTPEALILQNCGLRRSKGEPCAPLPFYGRINDPNFTFGRFTASSKEPGAEEMHIAAFAVSGRAGTAPFDFVRGGDDQAQSSIINPFRTAQQGHNYWVGPLPGVDARSIMIMRKRPEVDPNGPFGQRLIAQAYAMCGGTPGAQSPCSGSVRDGRPEPADCVEQLPNTKPLALAAGLALLGGAVGGALFLTLKGGVRSFLPARWA